MTRGSFHHDVLFALTSSLPGRIDDEAPAVHVTGIVDVTRPGEVLGVEVSYSVDGRPRRRRAFRWTEWEPFEDGSAAAVASGTDMLIRVELREAVNAVPPGNRTAVPSDGK